MISYKIVFKDPADIKATLSTGSGDGLLPNR